MNFFARVGMLDTGEEEIQQVGEEILKFDNRVGSLIEQEVVDRPEKK